MKKKKISPALSGPTINNPARNANRLPPPAATVLISNCGATIDTPFIRKAPCSITKCTCERCSTHLL